MLIPDFQGDEAALRIVLDAGPDVLNHNIETVPRLYRIARPGGRYPRALEVLRRSTTIAPAIATKSGLMVGLGEEWDEVVATLQDLRAAGVNIVTIGQYLRPSVANLPMVRYYTPAEFAELKRIGLELGFGHVESGPLVRSSYHAHEQADAALVNGNRVIGNRATVTPTTDCLPSDSASNNSPCIDSNAAATPRELTVSSCCVISRPISSCRSDTRNGMMASVTL